MIACLLLGNTLHAQIRRDTASTPPRPVYNQFQFPNYYQNNSMFSNNSMQTNQPPNPFAGPYTGNANYNDPTKSTPGAAPYNNANVTPQAQPAIKTQK